MPTLSFILTSIAGLVLLGFIVCLIWTSRSHRQWLLKQEAFWRRHKTQDQQVDASLAKAIEDLKQDQLELDRLRIMQMYTNEVLCAYETKLDELGLVDTEVHREYCEKQRADGNHVIGDCQITCETCRKAVDYGIVEPTRQT